MLKPLTCMPAIYGEADTDLGGRPPARVRPPAGPPARRIGEEAGDGALVRGSIAGGVHMAATASGGKWSRKSVMRPLALTAFLSNHGWNEVRLQSSP